MRISKRFKLKRTQFELDFVDIDPKKDKRLFLDPYFLANRNDPWSMEATRSIQSFFAQFLSLLRSGKETDARELFSHLREPNETCLGLSRGRPRGRGVGNKFANRIFESLKKSKAVQTGLIEDLEDARIFIPGIGKDLTSDMTTNIIRGQLIGYTQNQCELWGIPLVAGVASGWIWDRNTKSWTSKHTERLLVDDAPILLVPKSVVSYVKQFTYEDYRQHPVLEFLQNEHLSLNSALVKTQHYKDGSEHRYVTKKDILASETIDKEFLARFTAQHPEIFANFRTDVASRLSSLSDNDLTNEDRAAVIDHMIARLEQTEPGPTDATKYHRNVVGILELLFYPDLMSPYKEREIHEGRKRIDITFDNAANGGFFWRVHQKNNIPAHFIMVECKNYGRDVANPELDQIAGRFSTNRGKVGLLVCRTIDDMSLFLKRCADTYRDDRGVIIPLVDSDLISMLNRLRDGEARPAEHLITDRFRDIVLI